MNHQAFAQLLGNYGEFVGAIAVVATLIYLATQIRQNNELLRSGSRQTLVSNEPDDVTHHQRLVELAIRRNDPGVLTPAYLGLAACLVRGGDEARAQGVYEQVLVNESGKGQYKEMLELKEEGNTFFRSGDYLKAAATYTKAIKAAADHGIEK